MKDFHRENPLFSLCGLNCGLCQMYVGGYCPGCGGGAGNQSCAIARCSREQGYLPYCFLCKDYPCPRYEGFDTYDSFLPSTNRQKDVARVKQIGLDAYMGELQEKMRALNRLLSDYNDGRRKHFFLTAVYLLDIADVQAVMDGLPSLELPLKERAALAVEQFKAIGTERGIEFKLHKKPKK